LIVAYCLLRVNTYQMQEGGYGTSPNRDSIGNQRWNHKSIQLAQHHRASARSAKGHPTNPLHSLFPPLFFQQIVFHNQRIYFLFPPNHRASRPVSLKVMEQLWEKMKENGAKLKPVLGNCFMRAYATHGDADAALRWMEMMRKNGVKSDVGSYNRVIEALVAKETCKLRRSGWN
jgi:pentatricopeptide repeat protein